MHLKGCTRGYIATPVDDGVETRSVSMLQTGLSCRSYLRRISLASRLDDTRWMRLCDCTFMKTFAIGSSC